LILHIANGAGGVFHLVCHIGTAFRPHPNRPLGGRGDSPRRCEDVESSTQVEESKLVPLPPANQDSTETESDSLSGGANAARRRVRRARVRQVVRRLQRTKHCAVALRVASSKLFPFKHSEAALECLAGNRALCVLSPSKSSRFDKRCQMKKRGAWQRMLS